MSLFICVSVLPITTISALLQIHLSLKNQRDLEEERCIREMTV